MEFENKAKDAENRGDYLSAIKFYFQALDALKEIQLLEQFKFDLGKISHQIANLYTEIGNFDTAIQHYKDASHFFLESDEQLIKIYRLAGECHSSIGACHLTEINYKLALEHFHKAADYSEKAAELEVAVLKKYDLERTILNLALSTLCLINLKKKDTDIIPILEKGALLARNFNITGFSRSLILFFTHLLNNKSAEAHLILKEKIEDKADSSFFPSTLQATVMGQIMDLASKYIPEAKIQIKDKIIEEKGEVILTKRIYEDMLLYALSYANKMIPRSEWKEVYALIVGKIKKDDVIITEIVPMTSGSEVEVEFQNEHYTKAAIIDSMAAERNEFIVGWFHTHPGLGLFLSPTDILNQLGYQSLNEKAIAIVFDFTQWTPLKPGFAIFRLDDPSIGQSSYFHSVKWQIKDANKQLFAESISLFENFINTLNNLLQKNRQLSLAQLSQEVNRSEIFLSEIIPQLIALKYLSNILFDPNSKIISVK
ncbi:MAG TPA: hypothetical protein VMV49_08380 [Candidatus Deferrimicrobium sp.]|nr:hypothetical protein [Candidatus Deferrimicrobium sp.]